MVPGVHRATHASLATVQRAPPRNGEGSKGRMNDELAMSRLSAVIAGERFDGFLRSIAQMNLLNSSKSYISLDFI